MTIPNDLRREAERVAKRLKRAKCEPATFTANEGDIRTLEGWFVCGLPPIEKEICQLILTEEGELYLRHATIPPKREDAKSFIEKLPAVRVTVRGNWSTQTLASRIDHLLTENGLTD